MNLVHRKIPVEFLDALPEGMKFIHRQGQEFLVVEQLYCPAGHSLMVESVRIHGEPSIRFRVSPDDPDRLIFLDAFWGSHAKLFSFIPCTQDNVQYVDAYCPDCGASLSINQRCSLDECDSTNSLDLHLPGGKNHIYVCAKLGCPGHRLSVTDLPYNLNRAVSEINFFGHGDEELFRGI
ncbi:hypothetical protein [Salinispira pacifica]